MDLQDRRKEEREREEKQRVDCDLDKFEESGVRQMRVEVWNFR